MSIVVGIFNNRTKIEALFSHPQYQVTEWPSFRIHSLLTSRHWVALFYDVDARKGENLCISAELTNKPTGIQIH
jgi:hypothetical protein